MGLLVAALRELLTGAPSFRAQTPWRPLTAIAAGVSIVVLAAAAASFVVAVLERAPNAGPNSVQSAAERGSWATAIWLLTLQVAIIGLVLVAAGVRGRRLAETLSLGPLPPFHQVLASAVLMLVLLIPYNLIALHFARDAVVEDIKPFLGLLRSPAAPLLALVIGLGAPISEELLFRGFLLGALSNTPLGFFGAALFTTVAWTALHVGYSGLGLLEVFFAGLFFSWVLWRTGNLWVPIICHALYNSVTLAILWLIPLMA